MMPRMRERVGSLIALTCSSSVMARRYGRFGMRTGTSAGSTASASFSTSRLTTGCPFLTHLPPDDHRDLARLPTSASTWHVRPWQYRRLWPHVLYSDSTCGNYRTCEHYSMKQRRC